MNMKIHPSRPDTISLSFSQSFVHIESLTDQFHITVQFKVSENLIYQNVVPETRDVKKKLNMKYYLIPKIGLRLTIK